jgi:sulfopyruvate decarboxylase TPP-binding subunit
MQIDNRGRPIHDLVMDSRRFAAGLQKYCDWFTGVPDSSLKNTQSLLKEFQFSSRENHAVAMAFGARMGGKKPCVLIQNSGLGLAIDSILGLFRLYKQGLLLVVSNRGELEWEEIQHKDWGDLTINIIDTLDFPIVDFESEGMQGVKRASDLAFTEDKIVVLLVHRGNLDE